jgi:hypothetical protein
MEEGRKGGREEGREGGGVGWSETFGCAVCEEKECVSVLEVHGINTLYTQTHTHTHIRTCTRKIHNRCLEKRVRTCHISSHC